LRPARGIRPQRRERAQHRPFLRARSAARREGRLRHSAGTNHQRGYQTACMSARTQSPPRNGRQLERSIAQRRDSRERERSDNYLRLGGNDAAKLRRGPCGSSPRARFGVDASAPATTAHLVFGRPLARQRPARAVRIARPDAPHPFGQQRLGNRPDSETSSEVGTPGDRLRVRPRALGRRQSSAAEALQTRAPADPADRVSAASIC
jgi:hypothetical protein